MRNGDLTNEVAPGIAIRFERVIKTEEGKLNMDAKGFINVLMGRLDVNVYVITTGNRRKAQAFLQKWGVPHTSVIEVETYYEIADVCRENDYLTYYDIDKDALYSVKSRGTAKIEAKQWTSITH